MNDDYKIQLAKESTHGIHVAMHFDSYFYSILAVIVLFAAVILASVLCFYIARYFILKSVEKLSHRGDYKWLKAAYHHKVFHQLARLVPAIIIYLSTPLFAGVSFSVISILAKPLAILSASYMVIVSALAISGFLNSIEDRYNHFKFARLRPIKSYLQVIKIIAFCLAGLIIVSILLDKSPAYFLTGIGAMTAIVLLVFKDSLLGFVASIQLAAYDMLRLGDWIEVPSFGVDGTVIDISLNTIKIQNFDKTIIMVPSYALLSSGIKNWRGMSESGSRRIKRSIAIDPNSVKFVDTEYLKNLKSIPILQPWFTEKPIKSIKDSVNTSNSRINIEKTETNLGIFRQYAQNYVSHHTDIHQDMTLLVRELEADCKGIPLEIYVFTNDPEWVNYEAVQSEIFEHLYAALALFGLKVFCKA